MQTLFSGIQFSLCTLRALLICIMCDLPACRKVCGFSNFNGLKGCSKCLKEFPVTHFGQKTDYSGFDCNNWINRDLVQHYTKAREHKNARTQKERTEIQWNTF